MLDQIEYLCNLTFSTTTNPTKSQVEDEIDIEKKLVSNKLINRGINIASIPYEYDRLVALAVAIKILERDQNLANYVSHLKDIQKSIYAEVFSYVLGNAYDNTDIKTTEWDFGHDHY